MKLQVTITVLRIYTFNSSFEHMLNLLGLLCFHQLLPGNTPNTASILHGLGPHWLTIIAQFNLAWPGQILLTRAIPRALMAQELLLLNADSGLHCPATDLIARTRTSFLRLLTAEYQIWCFYAMFLAKGTPSPPMPPMVTVSATGSLRLIASKPELYSTHFTTSRTLWMSLLSSDHYHTQTSVPTQDLHYAVG
jgi:hypothetical protein